MDVKALQRQLRDFAAARDWQPYHTPKNLAMALMVEAAELLELFQWLTPEESRHLTIDVADKERVADEIADVLADVGVVRGVVDLRSDRLGGIDEHIAACLQRRDRMRPFTVASAANVATFAAAYRYDLEEVRRIQEWAVPFYERSGDAFSVVNGLCFTGLAHHLMLDNVAAEQYFRKALRIAKRSCGIHSYTARLASSLLGELLYERGDLDDAERLLDEGYKLGPEGGSVDFKIARYVINARIKALQGDRLAAAQRLDEATRVARTLSLNRLRALAEHERIRLGLPPHPEFGPLPVTSYDARRQPVDGMDEIAVQFEEASAIRTLISGDDPAKRGLACRWAREWVDRLAPLNRPQALLRARRLLGACLAADSQTVEAKATVAAVAAQCAQLRMLRYLVDGGPHVVATLAALRADQQAGHWDPRWPEVPVDFLDDALTAVVPQRV